MPSRTPLRAAALLAALLAVGPGGCAKKAGYGAPSEPTATADLAGGGEAEGDLDALEGALAAREDQLRQAGVAVPARAERDGGGAPSGEAVAQRPADASAGDAEAPATSSAPSIEPQSRPDPTTATKRESKPRGSRCETVCELSTTICQLEDQICAMAPRHPDEPRYQAACQRADQDCEIATEACHACT